ncbi:RnfABCDGE type electron transport complex subunit D [Ruminococcus flavefaciens]|uniref:RnfABCDGE type electron transport complex subunit D n=1 Tax=Ruminococcus flavefaciens TaxID=1265 RepID=UPI0026F2D173|nr:RnfABCDGE type electron transport complex subunit D [Ruminococcus flavefaciens]MDD7515795.1 RnfABCDGE type electron transport complex subunit D [Ruminococcus flavefaciens]MDY5691300.1 RnfABCDGE type electron transport complex subunit D [Ruminococcus flavefaciens]
MNKLIVSPSPHDENYTKTSNIMLNVIIALLPAWGAAIYFFGARVISLTAVCIGSCIFFEYVCRRLMKRDNTIGDMSAVVTGLILAMNLPVTLPYWMAVIGSFVAIVITKQLFGGLGQNFANPAITARIVLMVSFPAAMTNWIKPLEYDYDAVSSATPLVLAKNGSDLPSYLDLFIGKTGGCLGEVCALGLLIGGLYLAARKIISLAAPVSFIGSLFILSWISGDDPVYQILAGGVFLGAFFMATDYATTPITTKGKIVFGLGCGIITFVIRRFGSYPEGVSFSILLMNVLTPYIEQLTRTKVLGAKEAEKNEG